MYLKVTTKEVNGWKSYVFMDCSGGCGSSVERIRYDTGRMTGE